MRLGRAGVGASSAVAADTASGNTAALARKWRRLGFMVVLRWGDAPEYTVGDGDVIPFIRWRLSLSAGGKWDRRCRKRTLARPPQANWLTINVLPGITVLFVPAPSASEPISDTRLVGIPTVGNPT